MMVQPMLEPIVQSFQSLSTLTKNAPWEAYKRPYVRDLAYVLACPNVLTEWLDVTPNQNTHAISVHSADFWQTQFEAYQQRLKELETPMTIRRSPAIY